MIRAALVAVALAALPVTAAEPETPRVALFAADGFPVVDAAPVDIANLRQAPGVVVLDSPAALVASLKPGAFDALVLPYGSAFPLDAWPAIRDFVQGGGGLVVLGGEPFAQPVRLARGC